MKQLTGLILLSVVITVITGCGGAAGGASFEDTTWVLAEINGKPPIFGSLITVEFSDGQVSGTGGCNSYFGEYEYRDAVLSISSLGMTEMYCVEPAGISEQETVYLTTLSLSQLASVTDGRLTLTGIGGATMVFEPAG